MLHEIIKPKYKYREETSITNGNKEKPSFGTYFTNVAAKKSDFTDDDSKKVIYQQIFTQVAEGVPHLNVPRIDPMKINNIVINLPNSGRLTVRDGLVIGLKNCGINDLKTYVEEPRHTTLNLTCDIEINGNYLMEMYRHGPEGVKLMQGKITIGGLLIFMDIPFEFVNKNGDIYLQINRHLQIYHYGYDKVIFNTLQTCADDTFDSIISKDLSEREVNYSLIFSIMNRVGNFFHIFVTNFFRSVPASDLLNINI